jgi:quercetin dioxygenase-like cupin family protein
MRLLETLLATTAYFGRPGSRSPPTTSSLIVDVAPETPRPYVLPNLKGSAVDFGGLIIRTLVSNTTSQGSLSLLNVNSGPGDLNLIHSHKEVEAFYTLKGSVQVFHNDNQGREMRANDFALLAPGNNHTYRPNDLDFQLTLGMAPGGIDEFFAAAGATYSSNAPFNPHDHSQLNPQKVLGLMPRFNISPAPFNKINLNWTNGTTADGQSTWRVANQTLPSTPSSPYFISSNRGPKFLHRRTGQVISQLTSDMQTQGKLDVSTIAVKPGYVPSEYFEFALDHAFQITEGQLKVKIGGEIASLIFGDVVFIPRDTSFKYWSRVGFTKFVVWSAGSGLADALIKDAEPWEYAVWPA